MDAIVTPVLDFISAHRAWAPLFAFLVAFAETAALVSLLIPSTAILIGVGGLVAAGALDFGPVFAGAALGALAGSTLSFWLGRRYGEEIFSAWPLSRQPELAERGRNAFARWGGGAVLIGHFFGPLRSVAFLLAGAAAMRALAFQLANAPGAVIWAYVTPKAGELGGDALSALWRSLGA